MNSPERDGLTKDHIVRLLREHLPDLRAKYGVKRAALYSSFARGEGQDSSDVDLLVELEHLRFVALANEVENLLGRRIDLATLETFYRARSEPRKQHIAQNIERDLVE